MTNAMKFIWAYMLENGEVLRNLKWDYYMGFTPIHEYDYEANDEVKRNLLTLVKTVGVDWDKTKEPTSNMESKFTDTFSPNADVEVLHGTIYLKNGQSFMIGVSNVEKRFSEYVIMLAKFSEDEQRIKNILGENVA